jgi:hypothetical protein
VLAVVLELTAILALAAVAELVAFLREQPFNPQVLFPQQLVVAVLAQQPEPDKAATAVTLPYSA